jgi:hypothetical protein
MAFRRDIRERLKNARFPSEMDFNLDGGAQTLLQGTVTSAYNPAQIFDLSPRWFLKPFDRYLTSYRDDEGLLKEWHLPTLKPTDQHKLPLQIPSKSISGKFLVPGNPSKARICLTR